MSHNEQKQIQESFNFTTIAPLVHRKGKVPVKEHPKQPHSQTGRYISYDRLIGQFNNQILSFQLAVCLAIIYNRTVFFQGFLERRDSNQKYTTKTYGTYMDLEAARKGNIPFAEYREFQKDMGSKIMSSQVTSFAHVWKKTPFEGKLFANVTGALKSQVPMVRLPIIYYWRLSGGNRCDPQLTSIFFRYVIPSKIIRMAADKFIASNLNGTYVGIHHRRLNDRCHQPINSIIQRIRADLDYRNIDKVYLATDGSHKDEAEKLAKEFKSISFSYVGHGRYSSGIFDQYILSKADVVYAVSSSTFSKNAVEYAKHLHQKNITIVHYNTNVGGRFGCR